MNDVTKELLDALKGLLVRVADDEEYGPDHAVTVARVAIARAEAALAEPQPDADGWIPWAGGECPLPSGAEHFVRLRCGNEYGPDDDPEGWRWDHRDNAGDNAGDSEGDDIIAYRIVRK